MKKIKIYWLTIAIATFFTPSARAFDDSIIWESFYRIVATNRQEISLSVHCLASPEVGFSTTSQKKYNPANPLLAKRVELDGKNIIGVSALLKQRDGDQELLKVKYSPRKKLAPGFHLSYRDCCETREKRKAGSLVTEFSLDQPQI